MKKTWFLITVTICALAIIFLRFWQLGSIPEGLTKDEAYYGYDAYSILKTGKDIWGDSFPLRFKSTGEYKLGLTYLIVPAIKIFDLTELAVRLPSAVFGLLTLPLLFLTLRIYSLPRYLALALTVVFALSPWSFGTSRLFYESSVGLFFVALGLYGLIVIQKKTSKSLRIIAPVSLGLSAYFYGPYLYIGFAMIVIYLVLTRKSLTILVLYFLVLTPLLLDFGSGSALKRLSQEWALKTPGYALETDEARRNCYLSFGQRSDLAKLCYPFWNKPVNQVRDIAVTALRMVSPEYLFFSSENNYIVPRDEGAYPLPLIILYFLGLISVLSARKPFLLLSLLLSVLIVSLPGRIELYRNPVGLYILFLFMAHGALWLTKRVRPSLVILYFFLIFMSEARYLLKYFTSYTYSNPLIFSSDSKSIYQFLESHRDYNFLVDRKFHGPIYAAFYWKLDPNYFRNAVNWTEPDPWGWVNAKSVGNIYSTEMTIEELLCKKHANPGVPIKALVISDPVNSYLDYASFSTQDFFATLRLHDIYDIDYLYKNLTNEPVCP